jgi:hypothetical protein
VGLGRPADGFSGQIYSSVLDIAGKYLLLTRRIRIQFGLNNPLLGL